MPASTAALSLSAEHREFIQGGVSITAGSVNAERLPSMARVIWFDRPAAAQSIGSEARVEQRGPIPAGAQRARAERDAPAQRVERMMQRAEVRELSN